MMVDPPGEEPREHGLGRGAAFLADRVIEEGVNRRTVGPVDGENQGELGRAFVAVVGEGDVHRQRARETAPDGQDFRQDGSAEGLGLAGMDLAFDSA